MSQDRNELGRDSVLADRKPWPVMPTPAGRLRRHDTPCERVFQHHARPRMNSNGTLSSKLPLPFMTSPRPTSSSLLDSPAALD